jgi:pimeloyl-ACP methyl ester carboxylesterase
MNLSKHLASSHNAATQVTRVFEKRVKIAQERFGERLRKALNDNLAGVAETPLTPWEIWYPWYQYLTDFAERSILFLDALRGRGNNFLECEQQGLPPQLHFAHEIVVDGRRLARPVNQALVRIIPPADVSVGPKRRPYVIIDPRAGRGPGIGGLKDDSQVAVALRGGHPVYFVVLFPEPELGQSLLDVCAAAQQFVHTVRQLHPDSAKPAIIGNCQGGWAAMMLAAAGPEECGPIVINGAPMSYWGAPRQEGTGGNPMRFSGGMFRGTWLASFAADLGNDIFDGAYLVENFESLNPVNSFWDKYYQLFGNVDTERPRFLEFERWWGGFYLMNREEIEWISRNLFVGDKLWTGGEQMKGTRTFDLRAIKSPIILLATLGDDTTPPQHVFNWVADIYGSTDEIKARGRVIVGLLQEDVGHLDIFVSGKVAKKQQPLIASVLKSIEALAPGLYGMAIHERAGSQGQVEYEVAFAERRIEEIVARFNRFERPLEAVAERSEFNQRAYELFAQPLIQSMCNAFTARPAKGQPVAAKAPAGKIESIVSEAISASLDYYRTVRDATSEALFFYTNGNLLSLYLVDGLEAKERAGESFVEPRNLPLVRGALASIAEGGYAEALARVDSLLSRCGPPLPLDRLALKHEFAAEYRHLLPNLEPERWRRIRGDQDIIVRYEPERAVATLPILLRDPFDRAHLLTLVRRLLADERVQWSKPSSDQLAMLEKLSKMLLLEPLRGRPAEQRS